MDYTGTNVTVLDPDIIATAYLKADSQIKTIISSILTSLPEESSFLYSYISNGKLDTVDAQNPDDVLGFTFLSGSTNNAMMLMLNAFRIFKKLPESETAMATTVQAILASLDRRVYDIIMEKVANNGK